MVGYDSGACDSDIIYEPESFGEPNYYTDDFDEYHCEWTIPPPNEKAITPDTLVLGENKFIYLFKGPFGSHKIHCICSNPVYFIEEFGQNPLFFCVPNAP